MRRSCRFGYSRVSALCLAAAAMTIVTGGAKVRADDWPQFRGPNCTGISAGTRPLPVKFSPTENVRWAAEIGDGVGCPVVADGRLFVSGMTGDETVSLFAFDAITGKPLWRRDWATGKLSEIHKSNSHASTTPAADADRVYFYFSTLGMLAVDARTGADVWQQKLPVPFFVFKWGPGMSPVLHDNLVLFCQDDDLSPAMYAFDTATGHRVWTDDRLDMAVNYSHPVVCTSDGRTDIVVAGTGLLIGYDPKTGERRWRSKNLLRNIKTTPVCQDGVLYVSLSSYPIAYQWLASVDQVETGNKDGKVTKAEMQAYVGAVPIPEAFFKKTFDRGDVNKDGFLEGAEIDLAFLHPDNFAGGRSGAEEAEEFILAVRGGGQGDVTKSHLLWKHPTKHTDHVVSPLVVDGRMLLIKGGGIRTVFDTKQGELLSGAKRIENTGSYLASPVYGDGKIYAAGENGVVVVLKNSPQFEVLTTNDMQDPIVATPAIAEGGVFIRTRKKLVCVAESSGN